MQKRRRESNKNLYPIKQFKNIKLIIKNENLKMLKGSCIKESNNLENS